MPGGADWQEFCDVRKLSQLGTIRKWRHEATWDEDQCWPSHEWVETRSERTLRETLHALPPSEFRTKQLRYLDDAYSAKTIEGELWKPPAPPALGATQTFAKIDSPPAPPISKADLIQPWSDPNFTYQSSKEIAPYFTEQFILERETELAILEREKDRKRTYDKSEPIFSADLAKPIPPQCSLRQDWLPPEIDLKGKKAEEKGLYSYEPTPDELESWKKKYGRQINGVWGFKPRDYEDDHFQAHQWSHKLRMRKEAPLPVETTDDYSVEELSEEESASPVDTCKSRAPWKSRTWTIENDAWNPQEARALAKFEQSNGSEIYKLPVRPLTISEEFSVRVYGKNLEFKLYDSTTVIHPPAVPNSQQSALPKCQHGVYNHPLSNCRAKSRHNDAGSCSWCKPVYPLYNERGEVFVSKPIRTDKALLNGDVHWLKLEPATFEQIEKDTKNNRLEQDRLIAKQRKKQLKLARSRAGKKVLDVLKSVQEFDTRFRGGGGTVEEGGTGFYHDEGLAVVDHEANGFNDKMNRVLMVCKGRPRTEIVNFIEGLPSLYLNALREGIPVAEVERAHDLSPDSLHKSFEARMKSITNMVSGDALGEHPDLTDIFDSMTPEQYTDFARQGGTYLFYKSRKQKKRLVYLGPLGAPESAEDWQVKMAIIAEYSRLLNTALKKSHAKSRQAKAKTIQNVNKTWDQAELYEWHPHPEFDLSLLNGATTAGYVI